MKTVNVCLAAVRLSSTLKITTRLNVYIVYYLTKLDRTLKGVVLNSYSKNFSYFVIRGS